jgi:4-hydroxy-tetrahydrodipicolinate synthase
MFFLSLDERVRISQFVREQVAGRVPVIASGHISDRFTEQVEELNRIAETGVDALVLVTNRMALESDCEDVWIHNVDALVQQLPSDIALGLYECPYPYKRLLSPQALKWCADTGRFHFLKDTSCDVETIRMRLDVVSGTGLKVFNANAATLLETVKLGVAGYSGVMANFHPELYVWLMRNWRQRQQQAEELSDYLSVASLIEKQRYPVNAKYHLMLLRILDNYVCRSNNHQEFSPTNQTEIEQFGRLSTRIHHVQQ